MIPYYSIFGCVNYYQDSKDEARGLRKRECETRLFLIEGQLEIHIENRIHLIDSGIEFVIPKNRWHGWVCRKDSKILQMIKDYDPLSEERKDWDR